MKNYDETVNSVLERIDRHNAARTKRKDLFVRFVSPALCLCFIAAIGFIALQGDFFSPAPPITLDDSTQIGENDYIEPNNSTDDWIGSVKINGINYVQYSVDNTLFTADKYLGDAKSFEGSYKQFSNANKDITADLYSVKESPNVKLVKLGNGGTVALGREGDIVVDGKTYFTTQCNVGEYTADKYLGLAQDHEIIEVPYRETFILPESEIWTVKEDSDFIFVKLENGDILIAAATE